MVCPPPPAPAVVAVAAGAAVVAVGGAVGGAGVASVVGIVVPQAASRPLSASPSASRINTRPAPGRRVPKTFMNLLLMGKIRECPILKFTRYRRANASRPWADDGRW